MAWTKEQGEKVLAALTQKLVRCPVCQTEKFAIQPELAHLTIGSSDPFSGTLRVVPSIVAQCKSCGHILLFNPILLGLQEVLDLKDAVPSSGTTG